MSQAPPPPDSSSPPNTPTHADALDCAASLRTAIHHIEHNRLNMAITTLTSSKDCHIRHETCPFRGQDCAVQDIISGFFEPSE